MKIFISPGERNAIKICFSRFKTKKHIKRHTANPQLLSHFLNFRQGSTIFRLVDLIRFTKRNGSSLCWSLEIFVCVIYYLTIILNNYWFSQRYEIFWRTHKVLSNISKLCQNKKISNISWATYLWRIIFFV